MKISATKICLTLVLWCLSVNLFGAENILAKPAAYDSLADSHFKKLDLAVFNGKSSSIKLSLGSHKAAEFIINRSYQHQNGDTSIQAGSSSHEGHLAATVGEKGAFGELYYNNKHYIITSDQSGSWLIELPPGAISYNSCGYEHKTTNHGVAPLNSSLVSQSSQASPTVIDLLVVYNQALADRYPGGLMQTRLNQYLNVTNQATVNSDLSLVFRLVGSEQIPYDQNNLNTTALNDMYASLNGELVLGMQGLKGMREQFGADIVIFIRPHDMKTRGNCGLAYFPFSADGVNFDSSLGVHMISDGMSSWSLCTDQVMIHELGHNLGAGHNDVPAQYRYIPDAAGFAKTGQFATLMGSFGTGQPTRFFEIDVFSNPNLQCGGGDCGVVGESSNVNVISQLMSTVASYQPSISNLPIPSIFPNNPDSDADGVTDWDDHFPFDNSETTDQDNDGVGDNADAFVANAAEQFDFDNDGVGNNQDIDDDNDSVVDTNDAFPFNALETTDTDNDGVGDNSDLFPENLAEHSDFDADGIGDNQDTDDDNDSFIDLDISSQDLLVINTGSSQVLRIDAQTGALHGIEVLSTDGLLTFQSDLTYRQESQMLFYTSSSGVRRLNLMTREPLGLYVPPYDNDGGVQIGTGFPTSLSSITNGENLAIARLGQAGVLTIKGQEKADFDLLYSWSLAEGDHPIDIISKGGTSYFLGRENSLYLARTPRDVEAIIALNGSFEDWFDEPYAIAVNSNDDLYVSNQNSNIVVMVNVDSGETTANFINLADHGYSNPTGVVVTDNNVLLVAASDQNAILRFNAETGSFLGELALGEGLDQPHKMILVPKLNDRFHHDAEKVITPNAGLWFNPATNGRGFDIQVFDNRLSVIWYTYDAQGLPTWYLSSGDINGFEYAGGFDKTQLNPDGSFSLENVGSLEISFNDERNARVNWQIGNNQGSEDIQWLVWSFNEEVDNYTGLWGRPDAPGWGLSVATIGEVSVAIPYVYDSAGEPRWLLSSSVNTSSPLNFSLSAFFSDTLCPSCSGVSSFTSSPAGTMVLDLSDPKTWKSDLQLPTPISGEWILNDTEITRYSPEARRPR